MIEFFAFSFFGILIGLFAGLLPGIHPNQIYFFLTTIGLFTEPKYFVVFISSIAVSNIVFSYLPTLFLSLPDTSTIMNVLPGHKMVLLGHGQKALFISLASVVITTLVIITLMPLFVFITPKIQDFTKPFIPFLLFALMMYMILLENGIKKIVALLLFLFSGIFGIIALNSKLISSEKVLFPALTGLFGLPGLIFATKNKIPKQDSHEIFVKINVKMILPGLIAGILAGILPGAGESQAGLAVSSLLHLKDEEIIGSLASINISNMFLAIITLLTTGKTRSGLADALAVIDIKEYFFLFLAACLFSLGISILLCFYIGKKMLHVLERIDYTRFSHAIIWFILFLTILLTGLIGVLVLIISTCMGMLPLLFGVKRTNNMGFLMVPVITYYL